MIQLRDNGRLQFRKNKVGKLEMIINIRMDCQDFDPFTWT